jgi:hypothetical protein
LRAVIEDTQGLTGRQIERVYVDKGYRGHDAPNPRRVFISGQKRGVFGAIKHELRFSRDNRKKRACRAKYPPSALSSGQQRRRLLATLVEWVLGRCSSSAGQ